MASSKSAPPVVDLSAARPDTVSIGISSATGRPVILVEGKPSTLSRRNTHCLRCGVTKGGRGAVCQPCYHELRDQSEVLVCDQCSEPFMRQRCDIRKANDKGLTHAFCSAACRDAWMSVHARKKCSECGATLPRNTRRLCDACKIHRRRERSLLVPIDCPQCGVRFLPRSTRRQFCSKTCADAAHSDRMKGKGNSHFKTGDSYSKLFKMMRPLIIERDCGCVVCGEVGKFHVHHINEVVQDNQPENLVMLCPTHHAIHHGSNETPWPWFATYAEQASRSMTSRWKATATSLLAEYSSTTV